MLSNHVYCTDLSNGEAKLNTIQVMSVHSYSLCSELARAQGFLPTLQPS